MVEIDEELEGVARLDEVRRLEAELHREWREREQPSVDDWAEPRERRAA
jgi:hypothetical protein